MMHRTRTPLRTWFWAAYLVATHHPGISAKQLQRQFGLSRYETAWLILQKLRRAMVAPERSPLTGEVEIDEFWLGGYEEGLKGSHQRGKKALVGAAIEVRGAPAPRRRRDVRVRYGLTKNIHTFKPTRVAFHEFADIARDVRGASSWRHRVGYLFRSPGRSPDGSGGAPAAERAQQVSTLIRAIVPPEAVSLPTCCPEGLFAWG